MARFGGLLAAAALIAACGSSGSDGPTTAADLAFDASATAQKGATVQAFGEALDGAITEREAQLKAVLERLTGLEADRDALATRVATLETYASDRTRWRGSRRVAANSPCREMPVRIGRRGLRALVQRVAGSEVTTSMVRARRAVSPYIVILSERQPFVANLNGWCKVHSGWARCSAARRAGGRRRQAKRTE
jgi:hypothetical protein